MNRVVILVLVFAVIIVTPVLMLVQPAAYLPHEKITIRVPYSFNDLPDGMVPMGETLYHPKPQNPSGHPGIDFGWNNGSSHEVLSSSDGVVKSITIGTSDPGKYDVEITSGAYILRYKEMDDVNPATSPSSPIKQGDVVGHVGRYCDQDHCWFNLHWELASVSMILDRWCPVTYLDLESRQSVETLWNSIPSNNQFKSGFPDICSGDYAGKSES